MAGPSEYSAEEIHRNNREESSEGYDGNGGRPPKRPRAFIARQVCFAAADGFAKFSLLRQR